MVQEAATPGVLEGQLIPENASCGLPTHLFFADEFAIGV